MKSSTHWICMGTLVILIACQKEKGVVSSIEPDNYLIAYNVYTPDSLKEDNYDIFIMRWDGAEKRNITNNPDVAWTYLAYDMTIFFISDRDTCNRCEFLYEMDEYGENIRKITDFRLRDSWMSTRYRGQEIIVNPHPSVDSAFYIIDRKGNILGKVRPGLPLASDPAFSPDGKQIVFRGGSKKSKREEGYKEELYLINTDGTGLKQLTQYPEHDTTAAWYAYKAGPPQWHPTENFISYGSFQNGKYSLFGVATDGSRQWKLTDHPYHVVYHSWSPNGKWLALGVSNDEQTQFDIALMNWETKKLKVLTDSTYHYQQAPVFVEKN